MKLTEQQILEIFNWLLEWESIRDSIIPLRFKEHFQSNNEIHDLSFSGIANLLDGTTSEQQVEILNQIDKQYNETKKEQARLEKELENIKFQRSQMVSAFQHVHKLLIKSFDIPLSFVNNENQLVYVKMLENNKIDYETYPITINEKLR